MNKKKALISVSSKENIVNFANGLVANNFEIISTGATKAELAVAGISSFDVAEITNFPEALSGRVKTLHPNIHAGILAKRDDNEHMKFLSKNSIEQIELVCVNLYPFKDTVAKGASLDDAIEQIDIGGPALIRAAAKNYKHVCVITNISDYENVINMLAEGNLNENERLKLCVKAFEHVAAYDALIAQYLSQKVESNILPEKITLTYEKACELRYGENPHQQAALYREPLYKQDFVQLHGKELSFNNITDSYGAIALLKEMTGPNVVAVKHASPCGAGKASSITQAYIKAYNADPVSIFGGIIAANREIDEGAAIEIAKTYVEIIIAPSFSEEALAILTKKKDLRLLKLNDVLIDNLDYKKIPGGLLVQTIDDKLILNELEHKTIRQATHPETFDMLFALKLVKHLKSNAIAIVKNGQSIGLSGGQVSRISACKQAIANAVEHLGKDVLLGAAMASDGFFPFDDCIKAANFAGITAIVQPGGSKNDIASIEACDRYNMAMAFTNIRHFRH